MPDNEIIFDEFDDAGNRVKTITWYITEMNLHGLKVVGSLTDSLFDKVNIH